MKAVCQTFKDKSLRVLGLNTARIVDVVPTVLPVLEVAENRTDFVFLLEDRTLLHLEFVTKKKRKDLIRYLLYDARLIDRDGRAVQTAVIYAGRITRAPELLTLGSITYRVANVFLKAYNGDEELERLNRKISMGGTLDDEDVLKLLFLPLMKSKSGEEEMTINAAELATTLPEEIHNFVIGTLIAISDRYLSKEYKEKLMEVIKMTKITQWLQEEGERRGRIEGKKEGKTEMAMAALEEGSSVDFVVRISGLSRSEVLSLKKRIKQKHPTNSSQGMPAKGL